MLISRRHRFIFVHIPKCGGTSVYHALRHSAGLWQRVLNNLFDRNLLYIKLEVPFFSIQNFGMHLHAYQIQEILGKEVFSDYWVFSFVRNPREREVSEYHYALKNPNHREHRAISALRDFDDFIRWRFSVDKLNCKSQKSYLVDIDGKMLANYVGNTSTIDEDLKHICNRFGIEDVAIARKNSSNHSAYQEYFNSETQRAVREFYQDDIEEFGFEFDS